MVASGALLTSAIHNRIAHGISCGDSRTVFAQRSETVQWQIGVHGHGVQQGVAPLFISLVDLVQSCFAHVVKKRVKASCVHFMAPGQRSLRLQCGMVSTKRHDQWRVTVCVYGCNARDRPSVAFGVSNPMDDHALSIDAAEALDAAVAADAADSTPSTV